MPDEIKSEHTFVNFRHCFDCAQYVVDDLRAHFDVCDEQRLMTLDKVTKLEYLLSSEKTAHQETREKLSEADELFKSACTEVSRLQDSDEIRRENARLQDALSELNSYDAPAEVVQLRSQLQETSLKLKECQERAVCPHGKTGPCERCISALLNDPEFRGKVISEELTEKERQLSAAITARDMNHEQWKLLKSELAEKERQLVELQAELVNPEHPENHTACISNLAEALRHTKDVYTEQLAEQAKRIEKLQRQCESKTETLSVRQDELRAAAKRIEYLEHILQLAKANVVFGEKRIHDLEAALGSIVKIGWPDYKPFSLEGQIREAAIKLLSPPVQPEAPASSLDAYMRTEGYKFYHEPGCPLVNEGGLCGCKPEAPAKEQS